MNKLLGPVPCQGCGMPVVYVQDGSRHGWLHRDGQFRCPALPAVRSSRGPLGERMRRLGEHALRALGLGG